MNHVSAQLFLISLLHYLFSCVHLFDPSWYFSSEVDIPSPVDHEMWPKNEETVWHRFDCWSYRLCPVTHVPWFSKPQWAHTNPRMSQVVVSIDIFGNWTSFYRIGCRLPLANKPYVNVFRDALRRQEHDHPTPCFADFPPQKEWLDKLAFLKYIMIELILHWHCICWFVSMKLQVLFLL